LIFNAFTYEEAAACFDEELLHIYA
jgi:hypothetical protein